MKRLFLLLLFAAACWAQTPSALESDPKGWTDILPDTAFRNWTRQPFLTSQSLHPESQWKVDTARRILICEGDKGHECLRYDKELANFIFHVEWRFVPIPGGKGYNSGVLARNSADATVWHQAQCGDVGAGWLFGNTPRNGMPQRVNFRAQMKESRVKPVGEWNIYEVRGVGPKLSLWVNGGITSEIPDLEVLKGYIGLEAEGYRIEFRNLLLKELP